MVYGAAHLYNWEILHSIEYQNEISFNAFSKIIESQENSYSINNDELKTKIENDNYLNSLSEDIQGSYFVSNYESEVHAIEDVKRFQRYSTCLALFSYFEGKLKLICELIEKSNSFKIKIKDLKGYGDIDICWNYLTKVYEIDITIKEFLNPITEQKFVRNKIAHKNGYFKKDELSKFKVIPGITTENYNDEYQIIITDIIYLSDTLKKMDFFLKQLLLQVDKRFFQINNRL